MMPRWSVVLPSIALVAACGADSASSSGPLRCGQGTEARDGECVPVRDVGADDAAMDGEERDVGEDAATDGSGAADASIDTGSDVVDAAACAEGARRCVGEVPETCVAGAWTPGEVCADGTSCVDGRCIEPDACEPGFVAGCFDELTQLRCNDAGTAFEQVPCPTGDWCFLGECGEQRCEPGALSCTDDGEWILECNAAGTDLERSERCEQGLACVRGECLGGCALGDKDPSYIGCEFWTVDLPQYQDTLLGMDPRRVPHSVVVANTSDRDAEIQIESFSDIPPVFDALTVPAGGVQAITFPRADVEDTSRSTRSFRMRTTEPIIAYQFNPLNDVGVASNDASLLLPAEAVGTEYYVMSWPSGPDALGNGPQTGWFTIVGTRDETTTVTIRFSATLIDGVDPDLQGITEGSTHTFTLERGDVMNFEALTEFQIFPPSVTEGDLTGTHIVADKPIVVFGGHEQAVMVGSYDEEGSCCADHLEQQLFPVSTWGTQYAAVHSPYRGNEVDYWRVLASVDGTRVTTNPAVPGLDGATLNAGEFAQIESDGSFEISATQPVLVGQFLVSQQDDRIARTKGDPAFVLAVPTNQYRSNYAILTPDGYAEDWITVTRPAGVTVLLDGVAILDSAFTPLGSGTLEWAHVSVTPGAHTLVAPGEERFGIAAYGYDSAVSYGFPGGLDLSTEDDE